MLQQGTICLDDHQNYARFWLLHYNNQKQDSIVGTGGAQETIDVPDVKALQEISQREKELILVLSAEENDLKSLKVFESMGTNIEARAGIQIY